MARKRTKGQYELGSVLDALMLEARMSIPELARAAGISAGPIKRIRNEGHIPKAQTLKMIAKGLATYARDRHDPDLAADYYRQLMAAAEYSPPAGDTLEMGPRVDDEVIVRRSLEARYGEDARFVAAVLDRLEDEPREERRTILGLLLGGIGNTLGRPSGTPSLAQLR